MRRTF